MGGMCGAVLWRMAFVCTVASANLNVRFFRDGSSRCGVFDIGRDDLRDIDYKGMVALETIPGSQALEYVFFIIELDRRNGTEHSYWSGKWSAPFSVDSVMLRF